MIATLRSELSHEWSVVKPILIRNLILKIGVLLVVWVVSSTDNQTEKSNFVLNQVYNPNNSTIGSGIVALADWDGVYFLHAILVDYTNLKQFAFYPGFPTLVKGILAVATSIPGLSSTLAGISRGLLVIFTGSSLNFLLHLANNWLVYQWLRARSFTQKQASFAALTFAMGGNMLYHLTFYSESSYMFFTLVSLWVLAKAGNSPGQMPFGRFLLLTIFFAYTGLIRSVGLVNGAYLGYPLVLELVYALAKQKQPRRAAQLLLRIFIVIACFFTPMIFLFFKTRRLFCHGPTAEDPHYSAPAFCDSPTGFFYSHIQEVYWFVRFMDYVHNLHHMDQWLWAFVSCIVASIWLKQAYQRAGVKGLLTIHIPEFLANHNLMSPRILEMPDLVIFSMQYIGYYCYAHLASVERFWSATPAYYMFLVVAQEALVRLGSGHDKDHPPSIFKQSLKYLIPLNLTIRQFVVPIYHSTRIYPV